jgi:hypothetical protein
MRVLNRTLISLFAMLLAIPSLSAQSKSDTCHVYVVDVQAVQRFKEKTDLTTLMNKSKEEQEKISEAAGLGKTYEEFRTQVGEEKLTTKTYSFLKTKLILTASVYYTDESMGSTDHQDSILLGITVAGKGRDNAIDAPDAAIAEVSYDESTDAVRVKKNVVVNGRLYLVGLECRCKEKK